MPRPGARHPEPPPSRRPGGSAPARNPGVPPAPGGVPPAPTGQGWVLTMLDPRAIEWPEVRITSQYREGEAEALAKSIEAVGQQDPIGVYRMADGRYLGADGFNRCQRAIDRGDTEVLCKVRDGTEKAVFQSNIATALLRGHTNPRSVVDTFRAAHQEQGVAPYEIAQAAGRPVEYVEKMLAIAECSPAVLDALGEELIALGHAEVLAEMEDHAEQESWLHKQLAHRWTVDELRDKVHGREEQEEPQPRRKKVEFEAATTRECSSCQAQHDSADLQALALCPDCLARHQAASMGAPETAPMDVRLAAGLRAARRTLAEAEQSLAGSPDTAPVAARISALIDLLDEDEREAAKAFAPEPPSRGPVGALVQTRVRPAVDPAEPPPPDGEPVPASARDLADIEARRQVEEGSRRVGTEKGGDR